MTAQISDLLIFDSGAFRLPEMSLYGVLTGDIEVPRTWRRYPFATKGNPKKISAYTALGRGYVSTYRLTDTGLFVLEQLQYPISGAPPDRVREVLQGSFWLDLREDFFGKGVRVPFVDGRIQEDRAQWRHLESE